MNLKKIFEAIKSTYWYTNNGTDSSKIWKAIFNRFLENGLSWDFDTSDYQLYKVGELNNEENYIRGLINSFITFICESGDYGTSPRYSWIEDKAEWKTVMDGIKEIIETIEEEKRQNPSH